MLLLLYTIAIFQSKSLKMYVTMAKSKSKFQKYIELKLTAVVIVLSILKCFLPMSSTSFLQGLRLVSLFSQ